MRGHRGAKILCVLGNLATARGSKSAGSLTTRGCAARQRIDIVLGGPWTRRSSWMLVDGPQAATPDERDFELEISERGLRKTIGARPASRNFI